MRPLCFFLVFSSALALIAQNKNDTDAKKDNAIVKAVLDGDCIKVRMLDFYGKETKEDKIFYLAGIDAPDRGQPDFSIALDFLKTTIEGKSVRIEPIVQSPLFIATADVYHKGLSVADAMILAGMAWPSPYSRNGSAKRYRERAVEGGSGMWKGGRSPDAPWEFREKMKSATVVKVISGDAFTIGEGHPKQIVRLYGVAAPWPYDPANEDSREYLKKRIEGKKVELSVKQDYRQIISAKVTLKGQDIAVEMLGKGLLWYDQLTALTDSGLDAAATSAQNAAVGIWSRKDTRPPWETCKQPKNVEEWIIPQKPKPATPKPETLIRLLKVRNTYLPFTLKEVMVANNAQKATWTIAISIASKGRKRPKVHYLQLGDAIPDSEWAVSDVGFKEKPHPKLKGMMIREVYVEVKHRKRSSRKAVLAKGKPCEDPIGKTFYQLAYYPNQKTLTVDLDQKFELEYKELKGVYVLKKALDGKLMIEDIAAGERVELKPFDRDEFKAWKAAQAKDK